MVGGGVLGYSAVHARVRAMYATMLDPETWQSLCDAGTYSALIETLKSTIYGPHLRAVQDQNLTSRRAVYQIKAHLAEAFVTLIGSVPDAARAVLTQLYRLYEVDNLKALLRGVVNGASWDQVRYVLFPLGSFTVLPAQEMMESQDVSAAIELLHNTPYYDTLAHAMERYTTERSLFVLEVALDLDYWREIWHNVNRLVDLDRTHARRLVGSMIDVNNLMWAIRYRVYHHLAEEEIINYTLPFGYQVQDQDIRAIAAGADIAPILGRIYPDLPEARSLIQEPRGGLPQLERQLQQHLARQCQAAFVGYPFHVGIPLGYLLLTELEIQDLTVLVEAKAMQVPGEEFRTHLVIGCPPAG